MPEDRPKTLDVVREIDDPFVRRMSLGAVHFRRYLPFYVLGLVWVLSLALVPTIRDTGGGDDQLFADAAVSDTGDTSGSDTGDQLASAGETGAVDAPGSAAAVDVKPGATPASGSVRAPTRTAAQSAQAAQVSGGVTRAGLACKPGVRQFAISSYATQCTSKFTGANGGATYRGVSGDKIRIVRREFPDSANSAAVEEVGRQAGAASEEDREAARDVFIGYFNKVYELYGRTVEWVDYESENGNSTDEAQSKGHEGACADATKIVQELKAFAVSSGSGPFSECAAERKLPVLQAAAYFPEVFYRKYHPYLWGIAMECERISYQVGEYVGERLLNRKAKWAGDPLFQQQNRTFATYVPDNDEYQHCVRITESTITNKYKGPKGTRYNYQLDVSRFPDQAAQAIVQFKASGATTVIQACDPISTIFLTQAADSQNYHPEWLIIGVALQDTDNLARLYSQPQVDGHLFGMSQLGPTQKIIGKNSEPGRVYKAITGKDIVDGTDGSYFPLVHMYNMLQAAGPNLTPEALAAGAPKIAVGGAPEFPAGYWSFADGSDGTPGAGDHTTIDDGREIYWVGSATAPDGKAGTYIETYKGKRFRNGEWPKEEPPVYPTK